MDSKVASTRPARSGRARAVVSLVFFWLGVAALIPVPSFAHSGGSGWGAMFAAALILLFLCMTGVCWLVSLILGLIVAKWITFELDLAQAGGDVAGTLSSDTVGGTVTGIVEQATFRGTMRLGWDTHDWQSLDMTLSPDLKSGSGQTVFAASPDEQHHYSIGLRRN